MPYIPILRRLTNSSSLFGRTRIITSCFQIEHPYDLHLSLLSCQLCTKPHKLSLHVKPYGIELYLIHHNLLYNRPIIHGIMGLENSYYRAIQSFYIINDILKKSFITIIYFYTKISTHFVHYSFCHIITSFFFAVKIIFL